ncbi:MAG: hypothetical protein JXB26_04580 [Candidatus Aminicenantes bacterium]|nr:hypothetical protein [Candidatus Aminicenantes bacterium]
MKNKNNTKHHFPEANKIPGLCYVFTDTGLELPVLDITHPLFDAGINEQVLEDLRRKSAQAAESMRAMPEAQKKMIAEKSYIFGTHYYEDLEATYLRGMSTYMLKLGPHLIGGGEERSIDRMMTMGVSGISARKRLRDLCSLQADLLMPYLRDKPQKKLCFVNIAGGAASDSINTLFLILKKNPSLLGNRKIEIVVFEIDHYGPHFAEKSIDALKGDGGPFYGLNLSFCFENSGWQETEVLKDFLSQRQEDLVFCSSEGGLFEYGKDKEILKNLKVLYHYTPAATRIAGTVLHTKDKVDPTITAMAETSGAALRFFGLDGLNTILASTQWELETFLEDNPVYGVFALRKKSLS